MNQQNHRNYILRLADTTMILGQRLAEWCGHGPALEEDIALTNIALDYIGQATILYRYAAKIENMGRDEDQMVFTRDGNEYFNLLITEIPNGDYAHTIARQFLFSSWYILVLEKMEKSSDSTLAGYAARSLKEVRYHLQHSRDWVLRMGDGTQESHRRIQAALNDIWPYTGEFFEMDELDLLHSENGTGVDFADLKDDWNKNVRSVLKEATLALPGDTKFHTGSKSGQHSEYLGPLLADMQFLQRAYPDAKW